MIKKEIVLPEESGEIIGQLLEKYGLKKSQEEGLKSFIKSESPEKRKEVFRNLPGSIISKAIAECAEGRIDSRELLELLKENLKIPKKEVEQLVRDLEDKVLIQSEQPEIKEKWGPQKPDVYREPIE